MCGIAGILSRHELRSDELDRAGQAMRHRGPDAGGVHRRGIASLIFRRLAILDLSPLGNQPMSNESGDVWIVFNGEIFDFDVLRRELEANHQFKSKTDTEVLVHGYEQWGIDGLLSRIGGMFAFAIWDERRGELFLARDRLGKKPLYYAQVDQGIAFASTLNSLLELLPERPSVDPIALDEYLVYQAVPSPRTIYSGIQSLPPAHKARWTLDQGMSVERYWDVSYARKQVRDERALLDELDCLVRNAVRRRLVSDVPLGAFLSGGVDSSLVVALMSVLGAAPVQAVTVGFDDPNFDERPFARIVAAKWGAHIHEHVMPPDEVLRLPEIIWHYGQPMADVSIVPTYAVARAARQHVTVVLNGDGGDELFAGYARPIITRAAQNLRHWMPGPIRRLACQPLKYCGRKGKLLAHASSRSARESFVYDRGLRLFRSSLYAPEFLERLAGTNPDLHYASVWDRADGPTDCDRALYGDLTTYLPDQLLAKMDVSTMAHSVEARSPLLDRELLEFVATIPSDQLTRHYRTKFLLKKLAERYVPREVLYRRKRGFVMPAGQWLRHDLSGPVRSILLSPACLGRGIFRPAAIRQLVEQHLSGAADWTGPLWTMLVLEIWNRMYLDGSMSREDRLVEARTASSIAGGRGAVVGELARTTSA